MKPCPCLFTIALLLLALTPGISASAQRGNPAVQEAEDGAVVCPPGVYLTQPDDCLPLGPSAYLTKMGKMGIYFPLQPLPAYKPDWQLGLVPYVYFKVDSEGAPLYPSLEAAMEGRETSHSLEPGFVYVSYRDRMETKKGAFYLLGSGEWMPGRGSRISPHTFQGLLFSSTPRSAFGWVLTQTESRRTPGYDGEITGRALNRFTIVQVYSTQSIGNLEWELIGPDEWVEARFVARLDPARTPPQGIVTGRWIEINLYEQTLAVYEDNQLIFATLLSSGVEPFWTRPGLFQIYKKKAIETMSGSFEPDRSDYYYLEDVPWTMYYDQARALHGVYWHTYFGYPQSHGCVNLSIGDARWLYDWAHEGDWVYVHDPSGRTPTDPALYGAGAP